MFGPIDKLTASAQIVDRIRAAVLGGELRPGEPIDSERTLAQAFGVNRATVREAIGALAVLGLVEVRQGESTRVAALHKASPSLIPHLLRPGVLERGKIMRDLLEVRAALLVWAAGRAAQRSTREGVEVLDAIVEELVAATEPKRRQQLDFEFFRAVVSLTDNQVLRLLVNPIRAAYELHRGSFEEIFGDGDFDAEHYRRVADGIRSGERKNAESAMRAFAAGAEILLEGRS